MANINTELEQIRKAVYGREVRGSIANAIELINKEQVNTSTAQTNLDGKFNQLIINAGNSNAEVVAARVKADGTQFNTLSKRLDKGDEVHNELNNEVISARTDSKNVAHKNLKARLDKFDSQLDTIVNDDIGGINDSFKPKKMIPICTFTFDDSQTEDYTDTYPLFKRKGIVPSIAVISDKVGISGFTTREQLLELQNEGWEICSHGKSHTKRYDQITDEELIEELSVSKEVLLNHGFKVKNMLTPFGNTNEHVMEMQSRYYRSARVSGPGALGELNKCPIMTFRTTSILIGDTDGTTGGIDSISGFRFDTLDYWKYWVDRAFESNSWIVFIGHSYMIKRNNRYADLEALIDYVKSKNMAIMTYDKALDIFQNKVETSLMKIGADGTISGEYGKIKKAKGDAIKNDTSFDDIPAEMLTFNTVTNGNASGLPNGVGGQIVTYKPDNNPLRTFSLLKSYNEDEWNQLFLRTYNKDKTANKWVKLNNLFITTNIPSTHTPTNLKANMITYAYIDVSNASGYPENSAGLLSAYFTADDWGCCYETYKLRNEDRWYSRSWNNVNRTWTSWRENLDNISLPYDSVTIDTLGTAFPKGTSYCQITGNKASFPEGQAGMLETHRYANKGYIYQLYNIYDQTKTYKRVFKSDGSWSLFFKIND